jgi:hypothetical protein
MLYLLFLTALNCELNLPDSKLFANAAAFFSLEIYRLASTVIIQAPAESLPKLSKFNNKLGIFIGPSGYKHNKAQCLVEWSGGKSRFLLANYEGV